MLRLVCTFKIFIHISDFPFIKIMPTVFTILYNNRALIFLVKIAENSIPKRFSELSFQSMAD